MKAAVSNFFTNNSHRRRSSPATMYDLIDQCHEWNNHTSMNLGHTIPEDYTDGFWKVFMLNEKPGKTTRCCERSSSFNTQGCQEGKVADLIECNNSCYCMKHSKTARRRRFKSQSGYYLALMPNGQIMGVKDKNSPYSKFSLLLANTNPELWRYLVVRYQEKNVKLFYYSSGFYLCMVRRGKVEIKTTHSKVFQNVNMRCTIIIHNALFVCMELTVDRKLDLTDCLFLLLRKTNSLLQLPSSVQ